MGISNSSLTLLMQEGKARSFKGKSILQLGRQHTFLTFQQVKMLAEKMNFPICVIEKVNLRPLRKVSRPF